MELFLLVGTYTDTGSNGISIYKFNQDSGEFVYINETFVKNPSYLVVNHKKSHVYSVSENKDKETSSVNSFKFDKKNKNLLLLNTEKAYGASPCYINIGKLDRYVVTANYMSGSISVFKTLKDGRLTSIIQQFNFEESSVCKGRQDTSHIHCVVFSPDYNYLFATDLGGDRIYKFNVNYNSEKDFLSFGSPNYFKVEAGSGPRHLVFHPNGLFAYLINELGGTVNVYKYLNGNLDEIQRIMADKYESEGSADIHISPCGKFLYTSHRLDHDRITIFSIDKKTGKLTEIGFHKTKSYPRNFIISPNGKYLLVTDMESNCIQIFERNLNTGLLKDTTKKIEKDKPVCVKFI